MREFNVFFRQARTGWVPTILFECDEEGIAARRGCVFCQTVRAVRNVLLSKVNGSLKGVCLCAAVQIIINSAS